MLRFFRIILIQSFLRKQESRYCYLTVFANPDPLHTLGDDQYGVEVCRGSSDYSAANSLKKVIFASISGML
jgi:hypothetical protein